MNVIELTQTTALIHLNKDELVLLNNALNEILHGVGLQGEFSTRMGFEEKEVEQLLGQINRAVADIKKK